MGLVFVISRWSHSKVAVSLHLAIELKIMVPSVGFHNKRKRYMEFFADLMQCGVKEIVSYW